MVHEPVYITPEGLEKLKTELDELVNVRRPALAERLHVAIKQGDLSENADYITAKEEQGFLEGRILELENTIVPFCDWAAPDKLKTNPFNGPG